MKTKSISKVGLFGGTFNPVHIGHLRVAHEVKEIFKLDYIYIVPSSIPPHKTIKKYGKFRR